MTVNRSQLKDEVFMNMALELSRLGTCCRLQVGSVLLRADDPTLVEEIFEAARELKRRVYGNRTIVAAEASRRE